MVSLPDFHLSFAQKKAGSVKLRSSVHLLAVVWACMSLMIMPAAFASDPPAPDEPLRPLPTPQADTALEKPLASARLLLEGVGKLSFKGVPGRLDISAQSAFPLFRDKDGKDIAAVYDDGSARAVILSHDAWYASPSWADPSLDRFLDNALTWLSGSPSPRGKKPRILCYDSIDMAARLASRGYAVDSPALFPNDLSAYDALVVYLPRGWTPAFDRAAAERLREAFRGGKPLMAAGLAWVFMSYGDGKSGADLSRDYAANLIFKDSGVFFSDAYASSSAEPVVLEASSHRASWLVSQALDALDGKIAGLAPDFPVLLYDNMETLRDWRQVLPGESLGSLAKRLTAEISINAPSPENPALRTDIRRWTAIVLTELISRNHPELFPGIWPVLGSFPGNGSPNASSSRLYKRTTTIAAESGGGWQTTGVYARAGETISLLVTGLSPGEKAIVRLGAHRDNLIHSGLDALERWPVISAEIPLVEGKADFFCRYSGPIYLDVPENRAQSLFISVEGGMEMPVWRPGMDAAAFRKKLRDTACPLVELQGRHIIFTQSRASLPKRVNPQAIMDWWDRVALLVPELLGDKPKNRPERFVADRQISWGYMHAGYPIMTLLDVETYQMGGEGKGPEWAGFNLLENGAWGHFHELGHNYQEAAWTFSNAKEVSVNLFTLFVMEKQLGIKAIEHRYLTRHSKAVEEFLKTPSWEAWSKNPFVALHSYARLAQRFGWDAFTRTFQVYRAMKKEDVPKSDQEKIDTWVLEFSRQVKFNLVPYYREWAWPLSPAVEEKLSSYPVWKI